MDNFTHLESNKPQALDSIGDDNEILERPKRSNIDPDVQERYSNKTLIQVEGSYKDLIHRQLRHRFNEIYVLHLLSHGGDEIPVKTTKRCNRPFGIVSTSQPEFEGTIEPGRRIWNNLNDLEDISLETH